MDNRFVVTVGAGTMRSGPAPPFASRIAGPPGGVTVEADFTGAHLLHLAAAGCVLNDIYREAEALGIDVSGIRVTTAGEVVGQVAKIPQAIRACASVRRVS